MTRRDFNVNDINLALDGELAPDDRAEFERWLDAHPEMKALSERFGADRATLAEALAPVLSEPVPARLLKLVSGEAKPARSRIVLLRNAAAAAVIFVAGGIAGYLLANGGLFVEDRSVDQLTENAIGAYVTFTAGLPHAVEISADDRAYLEGWLSKRTGLKVIAPDLSASGFELLGGRIVPAGQDIAALLVYRDKAGNQLSIYVVGEGERKAKGTYTPEEGGPTAIYWLDKGFGCAIVGALPQGQLSEVARNAWRQMVEAGAVG
jgi:anti-sigma factor RsiW